MKNEKIEFVVIIVLIVFVGVLLGRNDSLKSEIQDLSEKYNQISVENDELIDEYAACDELMLYHNSVAITVGQGIYYHKASCDIVQSALNTAINCKINNKVALKSQGYKPCPDCYPLDK